MWYKSEIRFPASAVLYEASTQPFAFEKTLLPASSHEQGRPLSNRQSDDSQVNNAHTRRSTHPAHTNDGLPAGHVGYTRTGAVSSHQDDRKAGHSHGAQFDAHEQDVSSSHPSTAFMADLFGGEISVDASMYASHTGHANAQGQAAGTNQREDLTANRVSGVRHPSAVEPPAQPQRTMHAPAAQAAAQPQRADVCDVQEVEDEVEVLAVAASSVRGLAGPGTGGTGGLAGRGGHALAGSAAGHKRPLGSDSVAPGQSSLGKMQRTGAVVGDGSVPSRVGVGGGLGTGSARWQGGLGAARMAGSGASPSPFAVAPGSGRGLSGGATPAPASARMGGIGAAAAPPQQLRMSNNTSASSSSGALPSSNVAQALPGAQTVRYHPLGPGPDPSVDPCDGCSLDRAPWLLRRVAKGGSWTRVWGLAATGTSAGDGATVTPASAVATLRALRAAACVDLGLGSASTGGGMEEMGRLVQACAEASQQSMQARTGAAALSSGGGVAHEASMYHPARTPPAVPVVSLSLCLVGDHWHPAGLVAAVLLLRTRTGAGQMAATPYLLPLVPDALLSSSYDDDGPATDVSGRGGGGEVVSASDRWQCLAYLLALPGLPKLWYDPKGSGTGLQGSATGVAGGGGGLHALLRCPYFSSSSSSLAVKDLRDPVQAAYLLSPDTISSSTDKDRAVLPCAALGAGFEPVGAAARALVGTPLVASAGASGQGQGQGQGGGAQWNPGQGLQQLQGQAAAHGPRHAPGQGECHEGLSLPVLLSAYGGLDKPQAMPAYLREVSQSIPAAGAGTAHVLHMLAQLTLLCDELGTHLVARGLHWAFNCIESPVYPVSVQLERQGVAVDTAVLQAMGQQLAQAKGRIEAEIRSIASTVGRGDINLNSPKQISELLYSSPAQGGLGLSSGGGGGGGAQQYNKATSKHGGRTHASTDEPTLLELDKLSARPGCEVYRVCGLILQYRKLEKAGNTFVQGMMNELARPAAALVGSEAGAAPAGGLLAAWGIDKGTAAKTHAPAVPVQTLPDGLGPLNPHLSRAHAQTHLCNTGTGRLTSSDPNLQQIPSEIGPDSPYAGVLSSSFRTAFRPSGPHLVLLSADYSQIEMRLLALMSGDAELQAVFRGGVPGAGTGTGAGAGTDVYVRMASMAFNTPLHAVTPVQRKQAKVASLAMVYGEGPVEMGRQLGLDVSQAAHLQSTFARRFPRVKAWQGHAAGFAEKYGHTLTLAGRRRLNPEARGAGESNSGAAGAGAGGAGAGGTGWGTQTGTVQAYGYRKAVNSVIQGSAADLMKLSMIHLDCFFRADAACGHHQQPGEEDTEEEVVAAQKAVLDPLLCTAQALKTAVAPIVRRALGLSPGAPLPPDLLHLGQAGQGVQGGQARQGGLGLNGRLILTVHDEVLLEVAVAPSTRAALASSASSSSSSSSLGPVLSSDAHVRAVCAVLGYIMTTVAPSQLYMLARRALRLDTEEAQQQQAAAMDPEWALYRQSACALLGIQPSPPPPPPPAHAHHAPQPHHTDTQPGAWAARVPLTIGLEAGLDWGSMQTLAVAPVC